jgi:hypothetical protein
VTLRDEPIPELLDLIDRQQAVIDARLERPARWRGLLRKPSSPSRVRRVAGAFDALVARARRHDCAPLTTGQLGALNGAVGGEGRYRSKGATLGDYVFPHSLASIPGAVAKALDRAADGAEAPPLAAARLHLELLLIHPFADGNGRTARLASSWVLLRAGYRSTLLTAVEQHVLVDPRRYITAFNNIVLGGLDTHRPYLRAMLGRMIGASEHAVAFRERETDLRERLAAAGYEGRAQDRMLTAHDFDGVDVVPLRERDRWRAPSPAARAQIKRLLAEESGDPLSGGRLFRL